MKNETARREIESLDYYLQNHTDDYSEESHMAMMMAIKALEQEPCGDTVSRQAVEEMIKAEMPERGMWEIEGDKEKETVCEACVDLIQKLSVLPPVNPQEPKTGHWIDSSNGWMCSECKRDSRKDTDYCPNCGAKMSEIPTGCSNSDPCENCKYSDGDCCRLIYEAKMFEPQERNCEPQERSDKK